jgi:hypothetical protein
MKHVVNLRFFCDDANGEWGLAHKETYNDNSPFNAFWSSTGIFHDVFEHWHEYTHKYFMGDSAMNIGGEMTAMGAYMYFVDTMNIRRSLGNSWRSNGELMRGTTENEIIEAISCGYTNFGRTLESNVPTQRPTDNGELEYQCELLYKNAKERTIAPLSDGEQKHEAAKEYKQSVTLAKIRNLHRYGYKMAEKKFPNNWENRNTLNDFITYWDEFTKNNSAEELANVFSGLTFTVYKRKGILSWEAVLHSNLQSEVKDVTLRPNHCPHYVIEDNYVMENED